LVESQTIVKALEFSLAKGAFANNARQKKAAQTLLREMQSNHSMSGRHQQLAALLKKGATIEQMMKATNSSRRTVFRYLNHFEEAGMNIELDDGKYTSA
jgi:DNA-binding NarL/FixJ family response regulator